MKLVPAAMRKLERVAGDVQVASKRAKTALKRIDKAPSPSTRARAATGKGAKPPTTGAAKVDKRYERPSGYRKGVRDKVWDAAAKASKDGKVRDPLTGKVMRKNQRWDMGHKPGYEFRKHQESAGKRGIDRDKFLDEHNDPGHYRPELPKSNQSHRGEDHTSDYFGP
ncbi:HNH/ENDO VII superfamily nuclease [Actinokineospora auranticolor]|uniref:HNH/ENDO VII superfamily nuclease n=2 Tax=Actinokineospora auranticolor TaxID=155976 RepID=A0A2S6GWK5_9PSEU|nr:HNH/ENDO VII superfamily nuclease [Actinokineospora auranticolor]